MQAASKRSMTCRILVTILLVVALASLCVGREGLGMPAAAGTTPLLTYSKATVNGGSSSAALELTMEQVCMLKACVFMCACVYGALCPEADSRVVDQSTMFQMQSNIEAPLLYCNSWPRLESLRHISVMHVSR